MQYEEILEDPNGTSLTIKGVFSHIIIIITTTTFALAFFPYTYQQITNGIVFLAFYVLWAWFSQDIRLVIVSFLTW